MRELELIDWICRQSDFDPKRVPVGPGDDCAIVQLGSEQLLVTTDQVLDGVHIKLSEHGAEAVGRKAMARNLSDLAAMACVPLAATATVSLPRSADRNLAEGIYNGLRRLCDEFHCPLVGGDIAFWDGPLAVSVTAFGRRAGVTGGIEPVLRSGARTGNALCVTGSLGAAWRTDRHLHFTPRIPEAVCLAMTYGVKAMIDLSDGLGTDLRHLCAASGVGAELDAAAIPIHEDALALVYGDTAAALRMAICDGEDYELLFALPSRLAKRLCQAQPLPVKVTQIGKITADKSILLKYPDGRSEPLTDRGWEHTT
jgi:thiamine-monophosphate kinase